MDQLTALERALLEQFEALAKAFETSQGASETALQQFASFSSATCERLSRIEKKQRDIESFQTKLLASLNEQSALTENLVKQVNALIVERRR
ncbi:hypothetical protein [Falsirhodobacter sp. 1013]|uniref:hypothetical protein n=1 Tax=Falsirhodobacter sp. 1013 TaxID=3417566 RepID=UPI003EBADE3D